MTRIILIGVPGSGKGTQARRMEQRFGYRHISTGDLVRAEVAARTPLGKKMKPVLEQGGYIEDAVIVDLVRRRVAQPDVSTGYILDGFPRTLEQARSLSAMAVDREISILLEIGNEDMVVKRILSRVSCGKCGAVYNLDLNPPGQAGRCDYCGEALTRRADDSESAIRNRFQVFRERTLPMLEYYEKLGELHRVNAAMPIEQVTAAIEEILA